MKNLQKLKEIFLSDDIDSEDYESNLADIRSWESQLIENKNMLGWQNHDITKEIMKKAKESYVELSTKLASDRKLTEAVRQSLFSRQDAMLWILSLSGDDPKSTIEGINSNIKTALNTV